MTRLVVVVAAIAAARALAQTPAPPPPPLPAARVTEVILDDRAVKDQGPPAFLAKTAEEIGKLRGMRVTRFSDARKRLGPKADQALAGCGDDAGCLATAARAAGGDIVVTVRLTKREGASFVALTRVNALRPQITDDSGTLSGSDADALALIPEAVTELFPDAESR
ncbi:MAG: hypothetical protein IT383_25210 [Deltaproteobacteria bacterium]|nr:hypothetical protein [Deltaproteobacteria bacterium]